MTFLRNPAPPRLPDPESDYSPRFIAALLRTLRLYFEQLNHVVSTVLGTNGGAYIQAPFGTFASTVDQTVVSTTTAYPVSFGATLYSSGVTLQSPTQMLFEFAGVYRVAVLLQFTNSDTVIRQASVWMRVNGVDVVDSHGEYSIVNSHGGTNGALSIDIARFLSLQAGDYVEIMWCAEATSVQLDAIPAGGTPARPASPSALAKVFFVSHY